MTTKTVCFDLDNTLIRELHSVMLPCILNGKEKEHSVIQEKEETSELDYIAADHLRAKLLLGLDEVVCGKFSGKIVKYIKAENKVDCLKDFCQLNNIAACDCVGDGSTDIPVFEYCGKSIAINASDKVKSKSTHSVDTDNLSDILCYIL